MKKILCLLLTFVLVFACVSCNKDKGDDKNDGGDNTNNNNNNNDANDNANDNVDYVAEIFATVNSSDPTQIVSKIDYTVGNKTFTSSYTTERDSQTGVERFEFHIKRYATIEELLPGNVKELNGKVWKNADGSVINSEGDAWSADDAVGFLSEMLDVKKEFFKSVELSDNNKDLSAVISAENSERVFGSQINASGDITLTIDTNGTYLYQITVKYTTASGALINIVTSYDYSIIEITDNK